MTNDDVFIDSTNEERVNIASNIKQSLYAIEQLINSLSVLFLCIYLTRQPRGYSTCEVMGESRRLKVLNTLA